MLDVDVAPLQEKVRREIASCLKLVNVLVVHHHSDGMEQGSDIEFNMFSMLKPSDNRIFSKSHDALNLAKLFQATLIFF